MKLKNANYCADCEEVFEGKSCPKCASEAFAPISKWVRPMSEASRLGEILSLGMGMVKVDCLSYTPQSRARLRVVR